MTTPTEADTVCRHPCSDAGLCVRWRRAGMIEHQLPRPWNERSEYQLLQDALDQIELADRLGYDHAWLPRS